MTTTTQQRQRGRPRLAPREPAMVQALDRGLYLLSVLAESDGISLSDLSRRIGLAPSSTYRLLGTLASKGFVEFLPRDQLWTVGVEAFRVGTAFQRRNDIASVGRQIMLDLVETCGETANIAVLEAGEIVFVSQVESQEPIRAFFRIGERRCIHASGIGKALLAELPHRRVEQILGQRGLVRYSNKTITDASRLKAELEIIHVRGWAVDDEECSEGMRCVAAAIFNEAGDPVAGLSLSGPSARFSPDRIAELGALVLSAAAEITRLVGGVSLPRAGAT